MEPYVVILVIIVGICVIMFLKKTFFSKDRVTVNNPLELKGDAIIINMSHEKVGHKGAYTFRTKITFDDGFVFEADDTERVNHFASYEIYIDQKMKEDMIARAKEAHARVCESRGIQRPAKAFSCGNCGFQGPYENNCPQCNSSLRKYLN